MQKEKQQRAPKGYRIEKWADGIYHVYCGGACIEETFTRRKAVIVAKRHAAQKKLDELGERLAANYAKLQSVLRP